MGVTISPRIWVRAATLMKLGRSSPSVRNATPQRRSSGLMRASGPKKKSPPANKRRCCIPTGISFFSAKDSTSFCLVCVLLGAVEAWQNWTMLQTRATTEAKFVRSSADLTHLVGWSDPLTPVQIYRVAYRRHAYAYTVNGIEYSAVLKASPGTPPPHVMVYYDPQHPQTCTFGPILSPWLIMLFACGIAAFLCFVGYQFRGSRPTAETASGSPDGKSAD